MDAAHEPRAVRFSIAHLALLVPWVAVVIDAWRPIVDSSFLWHVRAGSVQAHAGEVLTTDPFSFTAAGDPWRTQSWLVELIYAAGERVSGLDFVPVMLLVAGLVTFLGIGLIAYRESQSVTVTAVCVFLSTILLLSFLVPRPVLFSFLLFVVVIVAWDRGATRWTVPFLFWIWAAAHGSFVVGLAYVGLRLLSRKDWRLLPTAVLSGLATLSTAHGFGILEILLDFGNATEALGYISEWRRPALSDVSFIVFLGGLVFVAIGMIRGVVTVRELLIIVPFVILGISSVRAIPPAWFGLLPIVAMSLSGMNVGARQRFGTVPAAVFAVSVFLLPFLLKGESGLDESKFPIEASRRLDEGRVFHDDRAGGYLIYAEGPDRKVFIDDRAELYREGLEEFVMVRDGKTAWLPVFERHDIQQALLQNDARLIGTLREAGWRTEYEDDHFTLIARGY